MPDAVVLLDDDRCKAHGDVHKNFLTAWNDGFITEKSDWETDFHNPVYFCAHR